MPRRLHDWHRGVASRLRDLVVVGVGRDLTSIEFIDDDRHLLVTSATGPVEILTIDSTELMQIARDRFTRGFTDEECEFCRLDRARRSKSFGRPPDHRHHHVARPEIRPERHPLEVCRRALAQGTERYLGLPSDLVSGREHPSLRRSEPLWRCLMDEEHDPVCIGVSTLEDAVLVGPTDVMHVASPALSLFTGARIVGVR